MAKSHPNQSLDLDADDTFQRKEWFVQRIGWIAWGLILAAATAGLLGSGPLSHTRVASTDGTLDVTYERFVHYHHPTSFEVMITQPVRNDRLQLKINQAFLDAIEIHRFHPEPEDARLTSDGTIFEFLASDQANTAKVVIFFEFEEFGKVSGTLQLVGGEPATFSQIIYP